MEILPRLTIHVWLEEKKKGSIFLYHRSSIEYFWVIYKFSDKCNLNVLYLEMKVYYKFCVIEYDMLWAVYEACECIDAGTVYKVIEIYANVILVKYISPTRFYKFCCIYIYICCVFFASIWYFVHFFLPQDCIAMKITRDFIICYINCNRKCFESV